MRFVLIALLALSLNAPNPATAASPAARLTPVKAGVFAQEVATHYGTREGLPSADVRAVALSADGAVFAATSHGLACFRDGVWGVVEEVPKVLVRCLAVSANTVYAATDTAVYALEGDAADRLIIDLPAPPTALAAGPEGLWLGTKDGLSRWKGSQLTPVNGLNALMGNETEIRQIATNADGDVVVAAEGGLLRQTGGGWQRLFPRAGNVSWAVRDVRGVAFDRENRLWFCSPQGAGCFGGEWSLFTGHQGLPYNAFTIAAPGEEGAIWLGTSQGAIRYDGRRWFYREGRRWLPNNEVRCIAVTPAGHAWFATADGVGSIERRPMTLAEKAQFYEDEIDKYHRRTPYGYVRWASLDKPGDKSVWHNHDDDNDGQWTGEYGAAECFRFAATKDPEAKKRATAAFEALRFLSQVTQGGSRPAPKGFPARTILPTDGPRNPNEEESYSLEADAQERSTDDALWKILHPRWPTSADGKWYWKCDTSSDELDGHYFLNARYYDLVAETEDEKERVRQVVRDMTDHLIEHDYRLVDHDGKPTRWANFSPASLNYDSNWWTERGLNSLSILAYLRAAEHITGDENYGALADELVQKHTYAMNVMYPKHQRGPGSFVQFDDEMAFMNYYNLLLYEKDPKLREMFALSWRQYWELEACEQNAFYNFAFAALCRGQTFTSPWGTQDLSPNQHCLEDAVDTLKSYPLDLVSWKHTNSHRIDLVPLSPLARDPGEAAGKGRRVNGNVLAIDERFINYWSDDPWQLDSGNDGKQLATGMPYLLAYYMGVYHGFIVEE